MCIKRFFAALAAAFILIFLFPLTAFAEGGDAALDERMEERRYVTGGGLEVSYRIYFSPGYSRRDTDNPALVIIYLHGDGGKGGDNSAQLTEKGLLGTLISDEAESAYKEFPYIIVAPQCPTGRDFDDELLDAVEGINGELTATEVTMGKCVLVGVGSGATAAFKYADGRASSVGRLAAVGGSCEPTGAALLYDAGVDFFVFGEEGNESLSALDDRIKEMTGDASPVHLSGSTLDECLDYALAFGSPSVRDWVIRESYTSRVLNVTVSCNEAGGTIKADPKSVKYGSSSSVTLELNAGYAISRVIVNGKELEPSSFVPSKENDRRCVYSLKNVKTDQTVKVELVRVASSSTRSGFIDGLMLTLSILSAVLLAAAAAVYLLSRGKKAGANGK